MIMTASETADENWNYAQTDRAKRQSVPDSVNLFFFFFSTKFPILLSLISVAICPRLSENIRVFVPDNYLRRNVLFLAMVVMVVVMVGVVGVVVVRRGYPPRRAATTRKMRGDSREATSRAGEFFSGLYRAEETLPGMFLSQWGFKAAVGLADRKSLGLCLLLSEAKRVSIFGRQRLVVKIVRAAKSRTLYVKVRQRMIKK